MSLFRCMIYFFYIFCCLTVCESKNDPTYLNAYMANKCNRYENPKVCIPVSDCPDIREWLVNFSKDRDNLRKIKNEVCGFTKKYSILVCCEPHLKHESNITKFGKEVLIISDDNKQSNHPANNQLFYNDGWVSKQFAPKLIMKKQLEKPILLEKNRKFLKSHRPVSLQMLDIYNLLPKRNECASDNADRIVGGTFTKLGEFPWMALIGRGDENVEYDYYDQPNFFCGGALISNRYVLTAAHCLYKDKDNWALLFVRLGEHDLSTEIDCERVHGRKICNEGGSIDVKVNKIILNEQYDGRQPYMHNDISLIRLSQGVEYTTYIKPICLPESVNYKISSTATLYIAGWGRTEHGVSSDVKKKLKIEVIPSDHCQKVYAATVKIFDNQICAGGKRNQDSCNGDSGGPLMALVDSKWIAYGLVSFGPTDCGLPGVPGIYTKISSFLSWIVGKLNP